MKRLIYITIVTLLCSCASTTKIIKNQNLCNYDYSVAEIDKNLDTSKYVLDKYYTDSETQTVTRVVKEFGEYLKFIKIEDAIDRILAYNDNLILTASFFIAGSSKIGVEYSFDNNGNLEEIIDHDIGWNICWKQAIDIAKKIAKYNRCKEKYLTISRDVMSNYKGRQNVKVWFVHISFSNLKDEIRSIQIDGETGEFLGIAKIVSYIEESL